MDYTDFVEEGLKKEIQKKARADAECGQYSPPYDDSVCGNYAKRMMYGARNCVYTEAFHTRKLRLERK